jgi:hypothetical protein
LQRKLCSTLIDKENLVKDLYEMNTKYEKTRSQQEEFQQKTQRQLQLMQEQIARQQVEHKEQQEKLKAKLSVQARASSAMNEAFMSNLDKQIGLSVHDKLTHLIEREDQLLREVCPFIGQVYLVNYLVNLFLFHSIVGRAQAGE